MTAHCFHFLFSLRTLLILLSFKHKCAQNRFISRDYYLHAPSHLSDLFYHMLELILDPPLYTLSSQRVPLPAHCCRTTPGEQPDGEKLCPSKQLSSQMASAVCCSIPLFCYLTKISLLQVVISAVNCY